MPATTLPAKLTITSRGRAPAAAAAPSSNTCTTPTPRSPARPSARAMRRGSVTSCPDSPSTLRRTRPSRISEDTTCRAVLTGIAKLMP